jgi:hypothetical protein
MAIVRVGKDRWYRATNRATPDRYAGEHCAFKYSDG